MVREYPDMPLRVHATQEPLTSHFSRNHYAHTSNPILLLGGAKQTISPIYILHPKPTKFQVFHHSNSFQISQLNNIIAEPPRERCVCVTIMSALIEGLPDAVSIMCLARVPFYLHPKLELVSHSWRDAYRSGGLYKARREVNACEELLCVCAFQPDNLWQFYDPLRDLWITLPTFPSTIRHLAHFGVVSAAGKLFVLGGGSDDVDPLTGDQDGSFSTDEVWSYDLVTRKWSLRAPMIVPRAMFACCVLDGKIIVAGGFTNCRKSISKAEIYDPEKDVWVPIPDLPHTHNSACSGVVVGGKVHVLQKGFSSVLVLENIKEGWTVNECSWPHCPMAVLRGDLYAMCNGFIHKLERNSERIIASAYEFRKIIGCAMTGMGDNIYVIGGVLGPDRLNREIRLLSDIDVLTVGLERPVFRKLSPMTKCKGTVLGCTTLKI